MHPSPEDVSAPDAAALQDQALGLRESVNSSRARMNAQREQLARLRAEISSLRSLLDAAPAPQVEVVAHVGAVFEKTAADSAAAAVSSKAARSPRWLAPYAAILGVAVAVQLRPVPRRAAGVPVPAAPAAARPASAPEDEGADEALLLAHEWRLPGDEQALADRLDPGVSLPGSRSAWNVERTGSKVYRVSYRADEDAPSYEFDVDLNARRVDPTPDTADLIAPRLSAQR